MIIININHLSQEAIVMTSDLWPLQVACFPHKCIIASLPEFHFVTKLPEIRLGAAVP